MGLKEIYLKIEDKYYAFLEYLETKHIPIFGLVDSIEEKGIPTFPVAILLALIVIIGIFTLLGGGFSLGSSTLNVSVVDAGNNPIEGVLVKASFAGVERTAVTDSDGKATFSSLPANTTGSVRIDSELYQSPPISLSTSSSINNQTLIAEEIENAKHLSIQLLKNGTQELLSTPVEIEFSCSQNSDYQTTKNSSNGEIELDVPNDCGTLYAQPNSESISSNGQIAVDIHAFQPSIYLEEIAVRKGHVRVEVKDSDGSSLQGIQLSLKSQYGDPISSAISDASGVGEFSDVPADQYFISGYDSSGSYQYKETNLQEVSADSTTEFSLTLTKGIVGEIRVKIVDSSTNSAVANATVILLKDNSILTTKTTDEDGKVAFPVSSNLQFTLSIDHPDYLKKLQSLKVDSTGAYTNISIERATPTNSQAITVNVKDELGIGIENARVTLKKSPSGAAVGNTKITGAGGSVTFTSLEEGSYFVSASKPGFTLETHSNVFQVKARETSTIELKLSIGQGIISVKVLDDSGNPLSGASVQAINSSTGEKEGNESATGLDGLASVTVRADKSIYFVVSEPNHLPFYSKSIQLQKDITQTITIQLVKEIKKLEVQIVGIFENGEALASDSSLTPGATYNLKLLYLVPRNSGFSEGGIHLRTGTSDEGKTNILENDSWFIQSIQAAKASIQKGKSYTPSTGYQTDASSLTQGDAKWANVTFKNPAEGAYEIDAVLHVRDSAVIGTSLPLFYRAFGKSGGVVRFPVDNSLGTSESVSDKQGLYANANSKIYSVGPNSSLCNGSFCTALSMESAGIQTAIVNEFDTQISNTHKLAFTITNSSSNVFNDSTLTLSTSGSGLQLKGYDVTGANGQKKSGTVSGSKQDISVSNIQADNVVFGTVGIEAVREGTSKITLQIVSDKKVVMTKEIIIKVEAANEVEVALLPKIIVPFIANHVLIAVQENRNGENIGIEDASVNVYLNDTLLTGGVTNFDGIFTFDLQNPETGDKLKIVIQKPGIHTIEKEISISENILLAVPEKVTETLVLNQANEKSKAVKIFNTTSLPLLIKEIKLNGNFEGLVDLALSDDLVNTILEVNEDKNIFFNLTLTEKGQRIIQPRQLNGAINVVLENEEIGKTWSANIPTQINLSFGGSVDSEDCLISDQTKWDIFTGKDGKTLTVNLLNNCTVKGIPVNLRSLSARVKILSDNQLGVFSATTSETKKDLSAAFEKIQEVIPADSEAVVSLTFTPGTVKSGETEATIIFEAVNVTSNNQQDKLNQEIKVKIKINDLTSCVNVKTPQSLVIEGCPMNTGYGRYGGYFGGQSAYYNPSGFNQQFNRNQGYPNPQLYSQYSNPNFSPLQGGAFSPASAGGYYNNPYVDRYNLNSQYSMNYFCGTSEFRVENNCASDLEFDLGVDPNIQTSKNSFTIKPGESERISVESGYKIGKYPISVNAKVKGSTDASKEVNVLDFTIKSPTEINDDCISLDTEKYTFNNFIQKPVKGRAINNCYDQGVRIDDSGGSIRVTGSYNAETGTGNPNRPNNSAGSSLVRDIKTLGQFTQSGSQGTQQIVEFQIFPELEKYAPSPEKLQSGSAIQQTLDLRFILTRRYYIVESYATISVRYNDPFGQRREKPFEVIFEDLFNILPGIEEIATTGNSAITNYQDCINPNALTKDNSGNALVFDETEFQNGTAYTHTPIPVNQVMKISDQACGSQDTLKNLGSNTVTQGRVQAQFSIAANQHNISVNITRPSNLTEDVTFKGILSAELVRPFSTGFGIGNQKVEIPYEFTVKKAGDATSVALEPTSCTIDGYITDQVAYENYGFDKLKFDWTWDGVSEDFCSTYYCDATQLSIVMNKKVSKLLKFMDANPDVFSKVTETVSSKNLPRVLFSSTSWTNAAGTNKKIYYFKSKNTGETIIPNGSIERIVNQADLGKTFELDIATESNYDPMIQQMGVLLTKIEQSFTDPIARNSIVAIVDASSSSKWNTKNVDALLAFYPLDDKSTHPRNSKYILPFDEFKKLWNNYSDAAKISASAADDKAFLDALLSSTSFTRALIFSDDIEFTSSDLEKLASNGIDLASDASYEDTLGIIPSNHSTNVVNMIEKYFSPTAYLLKDGYSQDLVTDFGKVEADGYKYNTLKHTNFTSIYWNYYAEGQKNGQLPSAGKYNINTEITKSGVYNIAVKLTADSSDTAAKTKKYAENPLFEMPFNGLTGKGDKREGYGLGMSGTTEIPLTTQANLSAVPTSSASSTNMSYIKTIEAIQVGKAPVLKINPTTISFAPSIPVPLKVRLDGLTTASMQYAIAENLQNPGTYVSNPVTLINWLNCSTGKTVTDSKATACSPGRVGTDHSLSVTAQDLLELSSIVYVPAGSNYKFGLFCAEDAARIYSPTKLDGITLQEGQLSEFDLGNANALPPATIQEALQMITNNTGCLKVQNKTIEVIWNTGNKTIIPDALTCIAQAKS